MEQKKNQNTEEKKEKKSLRREIFEWIMVFVVAAALAFVVRTFIFEPVRVDGASMMYTLENGEFMIATKYDYLLAIRSALILSSAIIPTPATACTASSA